MKIHLIKDVDVSTNTFTEVFDLLDAIPGPIEFNCHSNSLIQFMDEDTTQKLIEKQVDFEKRGLFPKKSYELSERRFNFPFFRATSTWKTLFKKCNEYRKEHKIAKDEFVILLTEMSNDKNWFASLDESMPFNGFIHTSDWTHYIKCADAFPIAYEVIALMLHKHLFNDLEDAKAKLHKTSIGCVNDLCLSKKDIVLKLRTADICPDCMQLAKKNLSIAEIHHALNIMESLRLKMLFSQNFKQNVALSKLIIDSHKRIFLPDFGKIEIKLTPLEKTLYLFYLRHPEGVGLSFLCDFKQELSEIYATLSNNSDLLEMKNRIDDMVNITTNSAAEKISKIKRVFVSMIGDGLAEKYYIHGANGEIKKIDLDRDLVLY
jgi:hypothetical protein